MTQRGNLVGLAVIEALKPTELDDVLPPDHPLHFNVRKTKADYFYGQTPCKIFKTLCETSSPGTPVDVVNLDYVLERRKQHRKHFRRILLRRLFKRLRKYAPHRLEERFPQGIPPKGASCDYASDCDASDDENSMLFDTIYGTNEPEVHLVQKKL